MNSKPLQSKRKKIKAAQSNEEASLRRLIRRRRALLAIILSCLAIIWIGRTQLYPKYLCQQGELLIQSAPALASEHLEKAVALKRGHYPRAQLLWTQALLQSNQVTEALGCFSLIDKKSMLDTKELLNTSELAQEKGVPLLASLALERIPNESPDYPEAATELMKIHLQKGDLQKVEQLGLSVVNKQSLPKEFWLILAQSYEQGLNVKKSTAAYQTYLASQQSPAQRIYALRQLMKLTIQLGQFNIAENAQVELLTLTEPTTDDRVQIAKFYRLKGEDEKATELISSVLQNNPTHLGAIEQRGLLACDQRDDARAEADLLKVVNHQPWNKQAHYQLALCLQRQGKTQIAKAHFDQNKHLTQLSLRILELQSQPIEDKSVAEVKRLQELANAYEELGQVQIAEQLRQRVIKMK